VEVRDAGGGAPLALALGLVRRAQEAGEAAAWATERSSAFHPQDAAARGVDLEALPVVRLPGAAGVLRAGDLLVRSGAFALVVLDPGEGPRVPPAAAARLAGLARRHGTAVLVLVRGDPRVPCLGSAAEVRVEALRRRLPGGRFAVAARALRDRRGPADWTHEEEAEGPGGAG
jgi:hypothetical protein